MSKHRGEVERAALAWLVRLNDPDFIDWDGWEAWLVQDPAHAEVYWRLAEAEAGVVEAMAAPSSALAAAPIKGVPAGTGGARRAASPAVRRPQRRRWLPYAAAAAAAAVVFGGFWAVRPQTWSVETGAGEHRTVELADGSALYLDGATRVTLDRRRPRHAVLDEGRVLVQVVHDERRPFSLVAGDAVLTDLGTAFDVTRLGDGLRVAVSEGVVRVDVQRQSVTLRAGEALQTTDGRLSRQTVAPEAVGAWRGGRLVYQDERLEVVAEDLSRALGLDITVAPEIADRRFTGSLSADGSPETLRTRLELVLDVRIVEDAGGWRMQSRSRA